MKQLFPCFLILFSTFFSPAHAQDVTGVWRGTMVQDSPRRVINFEMALNQKEGKIFGYCYRLFIVDDSLIYNTVKVEARIVDSVLVIEDDKSVSKNYESNTSKVKVAYFFTLPKKDEDENKLKGDWTTNRLKRYMAITGTVTVQREPNPEVTEVQILKRLAEKKLDRDMKFTARSTAAATVIAVPPPVKTDTIQTIAKTSGELITNPVVNKPTVTTGEPKETVIPPAPVIAQAKPKTDTVSKQQSPPVVTKQNTKPAVTQPADKPVATVPKKDPPVVKQKTGTEKPVATVTTPSVTEPEKPQVQISKTGSEQTAATTDKPVPTVPKKDPPVVKQKTGTQKPVATVTTPSVTEPEKPQVQISKTGSEQTAATTDKPVPTVPKKDPPVVKQKTGTEKPVATVTTPSVTEPEKPQVQISKTGSEQTTATTDKPVIATAPPVIINHAVLKREKEVIQTVDLAEDSVVLSLYDNGEIDGDTVSVFLNNEQVVAKAGLKASAYKKTVFVKKGESLQLTLFAENLGSIPPNTGLLVIYSGEQRYQIHFTSTLSKSAVIVLRRQ